MPVATGYTMGYFARGVRETGISAAERPDHHGGRAHTAELLAGSVQVQVPTARGDVPGRRHPHQREQPDDHGHRRGAHEPA